MKTRQAKLIFLRVSLLLGLSACSASMDSSPTPTVISSLSAPTATRTLAPTIAPVTLTPTADACSSAAGSVIQDSLPGSKPQQDMLIYLPPCYAQTTARYPTLYLLHGQTYTDDQWVRLGVPAAEDQLIQSGEAAPCIIIFPDDHYWNAPAGATFGQRLITDIVPYIDAHYRTLADRAHRALGGLSRGGGWTVQLGFKHPDLFGSLGLHSPAVFSEDAPYVADFIQKIPQDERPRLWFDIGDADKELASGMQLEQVLTAYSYLHEFHVFNGDHTEAYWSKHVKDYLLWYSQGWPVP